jgi:hypothetical protein
VKRCLKYFDESPQDRPMGEIAGNFFREMKKEMEELAD